MQTGDSLHDDLCGQAKKTASNPAERASAGRRSPQQSSAKGASPKKKAPLKKTSPEIKSKTSSNRRPKTQERPISDGRVPDKKRKAKAPSKRELNLKEKRRQKINLAYVRLVKRGKTPDEARVILTKRKIRLKRIKTFGTVAFFFVFANNDFSGVFFVTSA